MRDSMLFILKTLKIVDPEDTHLFSDEEVTTIYELMLSDVKTEIIRLNEQKYKALKDRVEVMHDIVGFLEELEEISSKLAKLGELLILQPPRLAQNLLVQAN